MHIALIDPFGIWFLSTCEYLLFLSFHYLLDIRTSKSVLWIWLCLFIYVTVCPSVCSHATQNPRKQLISFFMIFCIKLESWKVRKVTEPEVNTEKKSINCVKGVQINISNNISPKWWPNISLRSPNKLYIIFVIMFTLCRWFDKKSWNCFSLTENEIWARPN